MKKIRRGVLLTVLVIATAFGAWAVHTGFRQLRLYTFIVYARAFSPGPTPCAALPRAHRDRTSAAVRRCRRRHRRLLGELR
jgi:hypothetical protein